MTSNVWFGRSDDVARRELAEFSVDLRQQLGRVHFVSAGLAGGYFARSACHFLTSSGLFVAVESSISRSRASGMRSCLRRDLFLSLLHPLVALQRSGSASAYFFWPSKRPAELGHAC